MLQHSGQLHRNGLCKAVHDKSGDSLGAQTNEAASFKLELAVFEQPCAETLQGSAVGYVALFTWWWTVNGLQFDRRRLRG